jgi:hypothetical protein
MTLLDYLDQSVRKILSAKRIGQPVFVRFAICKSPRNNDPALLLARWAHHACNWLGQDLADVFANGQVENGPVNLTLKCRQGASALLSFAEGQSRVNLMILGNHGAIYFDEADDRWGDDSIATTGDTGSLTADQDQFLDAVRRSLRSGKPESILAEPPL